MIFAGFDKMVFCQILSTLSIFQILKTSCCIYRFSDTELNTEA